MRRLMFVLSPWREPLRMMAAIVLIPIVVVAAILAVGHKHRTGQNATGACWGQFEVLDKQLAVGSAPLLRVELQYAGSQRCTVTDQAPGVQLVGDTQAAAGPFFPDRSGTMTIVAGHHPVLAFSIRDFLTCRAASGDAYQLLAFLGPNSRAQDGAPVRIRLGALNSDGASACSSPTALGTVSPLR